jgi:hypothetical protein
MKIPHKNPSFIELYGIFGSFEVPNSKYIIKYFSTFANNREDGSDYHKFLKELKPMRERTKPEKIDDLGSLLQRDLNDLRVSKELIPYLLNVVNNVVDEKHIAFFPAILCVLMPKGFIDKESEVSYPTPMIMSGNEGMISYNKEWQCEHFPDDHGAPTPLGKLKIDLGKTHIIVLDGQHRANAFRIIANSFDDSGRNSIYASFYADLVKPEILKADLPVTVVWFESVENSIAIQPDLISRRLFVDVNQNAKVINESRHVLLNDREPSDVMTRFFYSYLASNYHFQCNTFSLVHSGFDFDENLRSRTSPHKLTLVVPELMSYTFDWLFFGKRKYSDLEIYKVGSERDRKDFTGFERYFGHGSSAKYIEFLLDIDGNSKKYVRSSVELDEFESMFNLSFGKLYYSLYSAFPLVNAHVRASSQIQLKHDEMEGEWESPTMRDCWERLFKGGEGLYYVFNKLIDKKGRGKELANSSTRIEKLFSLERSLIAGEKDSIKVDKAFETFRTIAFQVGYLMAFDKFFQDSNSGSFENAIVEFCRRVNVVSLAEWISILTSIKESLVGEVDPRYWPTYKNLIIRVIQKDGEFFDSNLNRINAPEAHIVKLSFIKRCKNYTNDNFRRELRETYRDEIDDATVDKFTALAIDELKKLYGSVSSLIPLQLDYYSICKSALDASTLKK